MLFFIVAIFAFFFINPLTISYAIKYLCRFLGYIFKWIEKGSASPSQNNINNFNNVQIEQKEEAQIKHKVTSFKELYDYEHEEFKLDK
nr:MAG TPA: hypothetical protein [Caudoviricetes sp.]